MTFHLSCGRPRRESDRYTSAILQATQQHCIEISRTRDGNFIREFAKNFQSFRFPIKSKLSYFYFYLEGIARGGREVS